MKIFVTTRFLDIGGLETSLIFLLNKLSKEGNEIDLLVYGTGKLASNLDKKINVLYYNDYFKSPLNDKLFVLKKNILVKKILKKNTNVINKKYDISIAYNGFDNYVDLTAAIINSKTKLIWVHNDFYSAIKNKKFSFLYKLMYKKMGQKFKYFDRIVCVSKYTQINFNKLFGYNNKTTYCYNYIDGKHIIDLSNNKTNIKMNKEKFNIIAVGRLTKLKNFDKLILISKKLKEKRTSFHTYIIGDGEEYNNLNILIKRNNLEDCVTLLGKQSTELYSIMKQADLLVSMSQYESFGNVLIEGMILGIPYISNVNSGAKDIYENLTPDNAGIIINNSNILNQILKTINNPKVRINFNIEKYNKNIDKKLKQILK